MSAAQHTPVGLYGRPGVRAIDGVTLSTVDCRADDSDCGFPNCGCPALASHTPGPWRASYWRYGEGVAEGWYASRTNNGRTEWLPSSGCSSRFDSEAAAHAGIAKATGSAS